MGLLEDCPMERWLELQTGRDLDQGGIVNAVFWERVAAERLARVISASWPIEAQTLDALGEVGLSESYPWGETALYTQDGVVARLSLENSQLSVRVAGKTRGQAEQAIAGLRERLPLSEPTDGTVPFSFWTYTPRGASEYNRRIDAAAWDAIAGNYPEETRAQLERMMTGFTPSLGGQLILWQGVPGTGKTWALRALAWQWREWARFHYIVDPEQMLGEHADYLTNVLLTSDTEPYVLRSERETAEKPKELWRVLVLEDSGELIAADAKERTGQALSRLLNVVDGLIGQGLRVLVLVTTNEELRRLHSAVSRPGRCAAQIVFGSFDANEALGWLQRYDVETDVPHAATLAELYALREGYAAEPLPASVGFSV